MDIKAYNSTAWDRLVQADNIWTVPVDSETITNARAGRWELLLTPTKAVPADWFPPVNGLDILCLASGGGQQGPILAAAGARVTVQDNSAAQLKQDHLVAQREHLDITTLQSDMADLRDIPDERFQLIFHPVSNLYTPDVNKVWKEAYRVLKKGGILLSGMVNPVVYLFDYSLAKQKGVLQVKYPLPYSDLSSLTGEEQKQYLQSGAPIEFGHTLADQIGGQLKAGFVLTGFYEDVHEDIENRPLSRYTPTFFATRAVK